MFVPARDLGGFDLDDHGAHDARGLGASRAVCRMVSFSPSRLIGV